MKLDERYEILERLGKGGFGTVFRGRDLIEDRDVAIKRIRVENKHELQQVRRELAILRSFRLPNVVRFFDEVNLPTETLIVMDLVDGSPFPGQGIGSSWEELRAPTLSLIETVGRLHDAGIVHRDIKPDNVLVRPDGQIVLVDFGTSHIEDIVARFEKSRRQSGTPKYMAPERFRGNLTDARSDLYSIGVMLFQSFTGQPPHVASSFRELVKMRLESPPPPLGSIRADLPAEVTEVIDALLALSPEQRPRDASEVLALLDRRSYEDRARALVRSEFTDERSMMVWFCGPERLARRQSRAARELYRRTGGERSKVIREIRAWIRADIAHWNEGKLSIRDGDLVRLESGLSLVPRRRFRVLPSASDADRLLRVLGRSNHPMDISSIQSVCEWELDRIDEALTDLVSNGQASIDSRGLWFPSQGGRNRLESSQNPGASLVHPLVELVETLRSRTLPEALDSIEARNTMRYAARIDLVEAYEDTLLAFCPSSDVESLERIIELTVVESRIFSPGRARNLLARIDRLPKRTPRIEYIRTMLVATEKAVSRRFDPAEATLRELDAAPTIDLEQLRWMLIGFCRDQQGREALRPFVRELESWQGDAQVGREIALFFGARLAYMSGEFADSSAQWRELAEIATRLKFRFAALTNLMSALEAYGDVESYLRVADELANHPMRRHDTVVTGRIEWVRRRAEYSLGRKLTPDLELVDAVFELGLSAALVMSLQTEVAIAWRCGDTDTLQALIHRWRRSGVVGHPVFDSFNACLLFASGLADEEEVRHAEEYAAAEAGYEPALVSQVWYLLALGGHSKAEAYIRRAVEVGRRAKILSSTLRRDVVSQSEIRALAREMGVDVD